MTPKKLIVLGVVKLIVIVVAVGVVYSMYGCAEAPGAGKQAAQVGESIQK